MNQDPQQQPSQDAVFAASEPFAAASQPLFHGVDAFNPAGPQPVFAPLPDAPLQATCLDVHRSLSVYLDGELAPAQADAVRARIAECGCCQSAQAFQMQLRTTVRTKALDPMPDEVRARITRALGFDAS